MPWCSVRVGDMGQVVRGSGISTPPQDFSCQGQHRRRVPRDLPPSQPPSDSLVRGLSSMFLIQLVMWKYQRVQDRAHPVVRQVGGSLALPGRATSPRPAHPSPGGGRLQPIAAEDASAGALHTTDCAMDRPDGPSPVTRTASPVRRSRWYSPSGKGSRLTITSVIWSPGRLAMAIRFLRTETCLTGPGFLMQFRDRPTPRAVSLMREWCHLMGLHHTGAVSLFPKRLSAIRID